MTVRVDNGDGQETTLRVSMSTVSMTIGSIVIAVVTGIIIWVNAIQAQTSFHAQKLAVLEQADATHKEAVTALQSDLKEIKPVIFEIRQDQVRRQKKGW